MKKYEIPTKNSMDLKTRFLGFVKLPENVNDCWEWRMTKHQKGYGTISLNGKTVHAHRVSYMLYRGEIPEGLCVCHNCDNSFCVNPHHLFLGTENDNVKDRDQKGRTAKGRKNGKSKLEEEQIKRIKTLLLQGISQVEAGRLFGVSQPNISNIKNGKRWKHVII